MNLLSLNTLPPDELEAIASRLHPSIARNFLYLPNPENMTDEQKCVLFPPERVQRFYRDWLAVLEQQHPDAAAQAESESA